MGVSAHTIRNVIGIIGNIISFGLFLSPCPTMYHIFKKKSTEEFKADPYLASTLNCMFWCLYGLPFVQPDSILVLTTNVIGLSLELSYLVVYFVYGSPKQRKKVSICFLIEVIFTAVVATIVLLVFHDYKRRALVIGVISDVFNIMMYAAPLTIMKKVIKTKSVKYMPFFLSLTNFLNGCIWTSFALIKIDYFLLISNGLGALSGTAQLILYGCYFKSTPRFEEGKTVNLTPGPFTAKVDAISREP